MDWIFEFSPFVDAFVPELEKILFLCEKRSRMWQHISAEMRGNVLGIYGGFCGWRNTGDWNPVCNHWFSVSGISFMQQCLCLDFIHWLTKTWDDFCFLSQCPLGQSSFHSCGMERIHRLRIVRVAYLVASGPFPHLLCPATKPELMISVRWVRAHRDMAVPLRKHYTFTLLKFWWHVSCRNMTRKLPILDNENDQCFRQD